MGTIHQNTISDTPEISCNSGKCTVCCPGDFWSLGSRTIIGKCLDFSKKKKGLQNQSKQ